METRDAPRAREDPIERIGRLFSRLNPLLERLQGETSSRSLELAAFDLQEHLVERVTFERASTGPGAVLQLAILHARALDLANLAEGETVKEADRLARSCDRLAHSLANWLEMTLAIDGKDMGAAYFMDPAIDPAAELRRQLP